MASSTSGGSKYSHLSKMDPAFTPLQKECDGNFKVLWSLPMNEFRAAWKNTPPALPQDVPLDLDITHQMVPVRDGTKVEIRVYKSKKVPSNALLFLVAHGGGWVVGSHDIEEGMNRYVAAKNNAIVVSVDYRMAPEFPYPYAINDCFDVLQWCKANARSLGIDPERIIVGGGSAGGNIAAVLSQKARDDGVSGITGQVLNIPVTCHPKHFPTKKYEYGSYEQNKDAPVIDVPRMTWFWDQYLPNAEPEIYASPLLAKSLKGLPPAIVQVAGLDPLRDEGLAYADAMKEAGVHVTLKVYPGLPHGFYMFPHLEASTQYLQSVVDWINENQQIHPMI
ncbi:MAG: hypothetical protein M1830_009649 [Pleopsidium flavum]|nr:MAG: hypothetical protein M1830_009649 [Pleopsidium flavum]